MAGPYAIGSKHWPGLSKLAEEAGEVMQVVGKILGTGGESAHWDGSDLRVRLVEELGDLIAATEFVAEMNGLDVVAIVERSRTKLDTFRRWHAEQADTPTPAPKAEE